LRAVSNSVDIWCRLECRHGGTVRDSSAAVVPAAKVTATNEGTNLTRSVMTDTGGEYVAGVRVH